MGSKLYVGNLPYDIDDAALRECFEEVGTVSDVHIVMDRDTGRPRGFAFVTMGSDSEAQAAINGLNGAVLKGRPMRVSEAQERQNRGGGGGGGRGGHRGW